MFTDGDRAQPVTGSGARYPTCVAAARTRRRNRRLPTHASPVWQPIPVSPVETRRVLIVELHVEIIARNELSVSSAAERPPTHSSGRKTRAAVSRIATGQRTTPYAESA